MSIRLRLTMIFSTILAITLIVFSITLFIIQSRFTLNMMETDMQRLIHPIANRYAFSQTVLEWISRPPPDTMQEATERPPWFEPTQDSPGEFRVRDRMQLLDREGNPLDLPFEESTTPFQINENGLQILGKGEPWTEIIYDENANERLLVYNYPARHEETTIAIIQISRSLADRDRSLRLLGVTLIVGSSVMTLAAFIGGWFLAGTALKPVTRITQTAHDIGQERDFSARVHHEGPSDEIGRLAMTFNEMLAQLEEGYQQVAHALQVQRDFVADVSHELRTPLTTIRGNLELLKRHPPVSHKEQQDILHDLSEESERLSRLVSELLILARADAGRTLPNELIDVTPIIMDVVRQMRLLAPDSDIFTDVQEPVFVTANEDGLKQVLLILLDNAVKHALCPIYIDVLQSPDSVHINVHDSGPGMQEEQLKRIFDRFYRGDTSRSSPGFGLGLAIARALVEAQQGSLKVESTPGTGSTFILTLSKSADNT